MVIFGEWIYHMTVAKTFAIVIGLAVGATALCIGNSSVLAASIDEAPPASDADITYFYKNPSPERVAKIVVYFNTLNQPDKPGVQPPMIGERPARRHLICDTFQRVSMRWWLRDRVNSMSCGALALPAEIRATA